MKLGNVAEAVGKGLFAGAGGTAAMIASSTLEAMLRGRGASTTPAQATAKVLGVEPKDEASSTTPLITREPVEKPFFKRFLVDKSRVGPRFLPLFDPKVIISGAIFY